jgi:DnaJ-class molecular chaperone
MKNPYKILGCPETASKTEIVKKYKLLALKYHPDKSINLSDEEKLSNENRFKEITCAHDFLKKHDYKQNCFCGDYESFSSSYVFNNFTNDFLKGGIKIGNFFKNIDFDNIANNILKEVNNVQDMYNLDNEKLEKSQDIFINARVELIDIYNNVKKEILIDCVKKCKECHSLGYNLNSKATCEHCNGLKIKEYKQKLSFEPRFKNKRIKGGGNEELCKRQGDIFINILPKPHSDYRIIDDYNIFINIVLSEEFINKDRIKAKMQFLDLRVMLIEIINPIKLLIHEYSYPGLGLIKPNGDRGNLCINVIDSLNLITEYNEIPKVNISFI